MVIRIL